MLASYQDIQAPHATVFKLLGPVSCSTSFQATEVHRLECLTAYATDLENVYTVLCIYRNQDGLRRVCVCL